MARNSTSSDCSDRHACVDFNLLSPRSLEVSIVMLYFSNTSFGALGSVFHPEVLLLMVFLSLRRLPS